MDNAITREDLDRARQSGQFTPAEVNGLADGERPRMMAAGFTQAEINEYYGIEPPTDHPIRDFFKGAAEKTFGYGRTDVPSFEDYWTAGWDNSITHLINGAPSTTQLPEDSPMAQRLTMGTAQLAGDLPAMVASAFATGTASGGNPLVAAGAAFGIPAGLRPLLIQSYKGGTRSFSEFWGLVKTAAWETFKGAATGVLTEGAGQLASKVGSGAIETGSTAVNKVLQSPAAQMAANTAKLPAQIATMTTVGAALEGRIPEPKEFLDGAILFFGMHGAVKGGARLTDLYVKTGKSPVDALKDMATDPTVREDLLSTSSEVPRAYEHLVEPPKPPEVDHTAHAPEEFRAFAGSYEPTYEGMHRAAQDFVISKNNETGHEHLVAVDENGKTVTHHVTDNNAKTVSPSDDLHKLLQDPANSITLHHNHPSGSTVSKNDIAALSYPGSKMIVAHGKDGQFAAVRLTDFGRKAIEGLSLDAASAKLLGIQEKVQKALVDHLRAAVTEGRYTPEQATSILAETRNRALANNGMIEYHSSHGVDAVPEMEYNEIQAVADKAAARAIEKAGIENVGKTTDDRRAFTVRPGEGTASVFGRNEDQRPRSEPAGAGGGGAGGKSPIGTDGPEFLDASRKVLSKVSVGEKAGKKYGFDELYKDAVDSLSPLKDVVKLITDGQNIPVSKDPYKLARLSRGVNGKAEHFLDFGTFDFKTMKNNGRGLRAILDPVKDDLDNFRAYVVAKRAFDLEKRQIESGIDKGAAREVVKAFDKKFGKVFAELKEYQDKSLQYIRDAGLLTPEAYEAMKEANRDYVPFYRVMDTEGTKGVGKGFQARNPVKGIKGSERRIVDPIESIIKNTYLYLNLAEKNRVGNALVDLAATSPRGSDFVTKAETPMRPTNIGAAEIEKFLKDHDIAATVDADTMVVFRPNAFFPADNQIRVFRNGKPELYDVDPQLAETLKGLDAEGTSLVFKILGAPVKTLRAGVTLNPDFMARNIIRDQLTAGIFSQGNYRPFIDAFNGLGSIVKKDEAFTDWLKSGGANANFVSLDRTYLQEHMQKLLTDAPVRNLIKSPLHALRILSELTENATRVGEYKRVTRGAQDPESIAKAGFSSREVTLDFARIGARTRAVNQIVAFWNATVQGQDRMVRAFVDKPLATTAKTVAGITVPSVLLYLANKDDQRYKDLPQWQKDLYWIVLTDDHIFRIPKPFELGLMFGTAAERFTQFILEHDPKAFDGFLDQTGQAVAPAVVPTVMAPFIETWANKSLFTDAPLIPADRENMLPEYQYRPNTTELTKAVGSMLAKLPGMKESPFVAPVNIDQFIQDWSGGLGVSLVNMADTALRKTGVLPDMPKPAATLADMPFIKAFMIRHPSMGTQPITDFYKRYQSTEKALNTIKKLAKEGNADAAIQEMNARQGNLVRLTPVKNGLDNAVSMIRLIEQNPQIPSDEKRQLIDKLYFQVNEMAKQGNSIMDQVEGKSRK